MRGTPEKRVIGSDRGSGVSRWRPALTATLLAATMAASSGFGQTAEDFNKLKSMVEQMQKTIDAQNGRINELEKEKTARQQAAPAAPVVTNAPGTSTRAPSVLEKNSP